MSNVVQFPGADTDEHEQPVQEPLVIKVTLSPPPTPQSVSPITVALAWALVSFFSITVLIGVLT